MIDQFTRLEWRRKLRLYRNVAAPQFLAPCERRGHEAFRQNAKDALTSRCGVSTLMGSQLEEAGVDGIGVRGPADTRY
jgi:hypothetical protein